MEKGIADMFRLMMPLDSYTKRKYATVADYLKPELAKEIRYLLKLRRIEIKEHDWEEAKAFVGKQKICEFKTELLDDDILELLKEANAAVKEGRRKDAFREFSKNAGKMLHKMIAPNIMGMEHIKRSLAIQLFAKERFHVLLLGDPGTGKTDLIRSASDLAPISAFGLGSGVSGVGLAVAKVGKEIKKGLLVQAHKGLCCIDELNLMRKEDRASLYNAMEKGFVSLDKGGVHETFPAKVRLLATANPIGDKFRGSNVDYIRRHLPFDAALLSRFHLLFLIRKPTKQEFLEITKKIISDDTKMQARQTGFISAYIEQALTIDVAFPKKLEKLVLEFVEKVREDEQEYIVEISPRLVVGIINIAKARARMEMRDAVTQDDIKEVLDLMHASLDVKQALKQE